MVAEPGGWKQPAVLRGRQVSEVRLALSTCVLRACGRGRQGSKQAGVLFVVKAQGQAGLLTSRKDGCLHDRSVCGCLARSGPWHATSFHREPAPVRPAGLDTCFVLFTSYNWVQLTPRIIYPCNKSSDLILRCLLFTEPGKKVSTSLTFILFFTLPTQTWDRPTQRSAGGGIYIYFFAVKCN